MERAGVLDRCGILSSIDGLSVGHVIDQTDWWGGCRHCPAHLFSLVIACRDLLHTRLHQKYMAW